MLVPRIDSKMKGAGKLLIIMFVATKSVYRVVAFIPSRVRRARFLAAPSTPSDTNDDNRISVTGTIYSSDNPNAPVVTLFTKDGCTLCDKVKDVLVTLRTELPHSLEAIDITDEQHSEWFSKYKYDIPVLHISNRYWIKHRIDEDEARKGLQQAINGEFVARQGEPDAGEMERRQAEREKK